MLKKCFMPIVLLMATGFAQADLLNISSTGVHSATDIEAVACTIVGYGGPFYQGKKILYVFAESTGNGRDPLLKVASLKNNLVVQNDDWQEEYYINGLAQTPPPADLYATFLRAPKGAADAAVIYFADPGEPVCASTKEYADNNNLYKVQISITDVTAAITAAGIRSEQKGAAIDPNGMLRSDLNQIMNVHSNAQQ